MEAMTSAVAKAAPLKVEIRLAQAVSHFEADLSTEQKTALRNEQLRSRDCPPRISDVQRVAAEIDRSAGGMVAGGRGFGPRLINVLQAVQQFAALGDVIVGGSQNLIACGVWSLVRMTLLVGISSTATSEPATDDSSQTTEMVVNFFSYFEKVSALLMAVGRSAPRYNEMALLYPKSGVLQTYISEYFIVLVRLCHHLLKFTRKSMAGRLMSSLGESDMNGYQNEFDRWATLIKEQADLLMAQTMGEQSTRLKALSMFSATESQQKKLKTHFRILDSCSTYDYKTPWKEIRRVGNTALFTRYPKYQDWKTGIGASTLVCTGKLGSGKSVWLANMVDDLNLHVRHETVPVTYFFSTYDSPESLKARTVMGALTRQLLESIPNLSLQEESAVMTNSVLDVTTLSNMLQSAVPSTYKAYFILDGLDEFQDYEKAILVQQLGILQRAFPSLSVCLSFRSEVSVRLQLNLESFAYPCTISVPNNNPDITSVIGKELERRIENGKLKIGDGELILEIEAALCNGAHGMLLWVVLQIESLCKEKTDHAIRQALTNLPKDLPETFARILERAGQLVSVARRPLGVREIREALSVEPGDPVWDVSRLINDVHSALACCGCLITVDEEDLTVRFVHPSVRKFLIGGLGGESTAFELLRIHLESAHKAVADLIITYLNYGVFDTQVSKAVVPKIMVGATPTQVVVSTCDRSSNVRELALRLLRSRSRTNYDIGKHLADASGRFKSQTVTEHQFFHYAKAHGFHHIYAASELEVATFSLLFETLRRKVIDINTADDRGLTPLKWSVDRDDQCLAQHLLDNGADIEAYASDAFRETALLLAIAKNSEALVRILLEKGANVETVGWGRATPLARAAEAGSESIVRMLLEHGANINPHGCDPPLGFASAYGHLAVVQQLLDNGANIDASDRDGKTALASAAINGKVDIARLLLAYGAKVNTRDKLGRTPLMFACSHIVTDTAQLLLMSGADIYAQDLAGATALTWACGGYAKAAQLLLDHGANIEAADNFSQYRDVREVIERYRMK